MMRRLRRVDWFRVLADLAYAGVSLAATSERTSIPRSTLHGYKCLDAEPRHADGEAVLALWRQHMPPGEPIPYLVCYQGRQRRIMR